MNYQALYRVYRPQTFGQIKGQEDICQTLENIIIKDHVSHAYLFAGPRGTGKTSTARIFAKTINCSKRTGANSCEKCPNCLAANQNRSLDIIEIDAASNNGVAEIREIRDKIKYSPTASQHKIYIVDEVHMLSKAAFNALLKTLEEPPQHAIFILATTEPDKIPITILSRVQRFNFHRINREIIGKYLKDVMHKENIRFEPKTINIIVGLARGSLRDGLSIIDQTAAYNDNYLTTKALFKIFGIVSVNRQILLLNFIGAQNLRDSLKTINNLVEDGINIDKLVESLIEIIKDFIVFQKTHQSELLSLLEPDEYQKITITLDQGYYFLDILVKLLNQLLHSEVPFQNLTLAILKMNNFNKDEATFDKELQPDPEFTTKELARISKIQLERPSPLEAPVDLKSAEIITTEELEITPSDLDPKTELINDTIEEEKAVDQIVEKFSSVDIKPQVLDHLEEEHGEQVNSILNTQNFQDKTTYSNEEIINLLVQFTNTVRLEIKDRSKNLPTYLLNEEYKNYAEIMMLLTFLSAGKDFILFVHKDNDFVETVNTAITKENFYDFINELFGDDYKIYVITMNQWAAVKNLYLDLKKSNNLPTAQPIEKVKRKKKLTEKEYGEQLFGKLFNS